MKGVMVKLGFLNRIVIDAKGPAGGLAMMWKSDNTVSVLE